MTQQLQFRTRNIPPADSSPGPPERMQVPDPQCRPRGKSDGHNHETGADE